MTDKGIVQRLARIARSIEAGEVYYNASKLAWAWLSVEEIQDSNSDGLLAGEALCEEMEMLAKEEGSGMPSNEFSTRWKVAIDTIRQGGFLSLREVPEVRVCRACGKLMFGQPPTRCGDCGAHRFTFREFPIPWWPEPMTPAEALEALKAAPVEVSQAVGDASDSEMAQHAAGDDWSIAEVLGHLLHTERALSGRVRLIVGADYPALGNLVVGEKVDTEQVGGTELLRLYTSDRAETVTFLKGLSTDEWLRLGHHPGIGDKSVLHQASYFTKHERLHVTQIETLRKSLAGSRS